MEVFGWIMLAILGALGVAAALYFAIPAIIDLTKINNYKRKLKVENAKRDANIRAEEQALRDADLRVKDKELADAKLTLDLKKKEIKLAAVKDKTDELETKDTEIKQAVEQRIAEVKITRNDTTETENN